MKNIYLDWQKFKAIARQNCGAVTVQEIENGYELFLAGRNITWSSKVINPDEKAEFEACYEHYKEHVLPVSSDGKEIVRAESRPLGTVTCFTCCGDSESNIADGKQLYWDFSNDNDLIDVETGSGIKRKRIEIKFLDTVWIKEGSMYYHNAVKGSYGDVYIVCPAGQFYLKNDGTPALATEDTIVNHFVMHQFIQGTVPMGDEMNTESCSNDPIPNNYKLWIDITAPEEDNESNGWVTLEIYRTRTVVL